ncbi:MAG: S41 family peptidase [FCB group bacterium]|nr:S41 family peptidase [FCB group bacterium]
MRQFQHRQMTIMFFGLIALMLGSLTIMAEDEIPKIDKKAKAEIIDSVTATLNDNYVFPEVAQKMDEYIRQQFKKGEYKEITDPMAFTQKLTEDLREVCKDKHLWVRFEPDMETVKDAPDSLTQEDIDQYVAEMKYDNFGFYKLERMEGNIGYVDMHGFNDAAWGGPTAVAAMNFLANTDAIIFDMRKNGGGSPSMIQLISSYFFEESQHLNSFYLRPEDTIKQFWTQAHVQGPKMIDMPLYILTSSYTFSAAEEFTYNLKSMERATIIGETTGGGAHPVDFHNCPNIKIRIKVPTGRAINPITGTNWEGVGVTPHIEVPEGEALETAHLEAMKYILKNTDNEQKKEMLNWVVGYKDGLKNPAEVGLDLLRKYAGQYGPRKITLEDGILYYQREDRPQFKMIPLTEDTFIFEKLEHFRLKFITDSSGQVSEVVGMYAGGRTDHSPRTSEN